VPRPFKLRRRYNNPTIYRIIMAIFNRKNIKAYANTAAASAKFTKKVQKHVKKAVNKQRSKPRSKSKRHHIGKGGQTRIIGQGLAGETSHVTIYNKPPRKSHYQVIQKLGNNSTLVVTTTGGTQAPAGRQATGTYFIANSKNDVQLCWSSGSKFYNASAAAFVSPSMSAAAVKCNKFFLKAVHSKIELTNQSPAVSNLEIWTVISKVTKPLYVAPQSDWQLGLDDQAPTVESVDEVGVRPTQSKLFNMNWRVKSVKKIQLMGGETHTHFNKFYCNRYMDAEYWNTYEQIRGITMVTFIINWGQIGDTSNAAALGTITTVPTKIIGLIQKTYTYSIASAFPKNYTTSGSLATDPQASMYVVNEEAGNILNVQDVTPNVVYA